MQDEEVVKEYKTKKERAASPVTGDTVRLDTLKRSPSPAHSSGDTMVFKPVEDDTMVFAAIEGEPEEEYPLPQEAFGKSQAEPFSENWEPEYEEPMGTYTPPIAFKPKDRLRQLRAKIVEGPERRYYELTELGVGKLQAGILLNFLIFLMAAGTTVLYAMDLIGPERQKLLVFGQLLFMLLSSLVGCYRLMEGVQDLLKLRFSLNSLLVFTGILCFLDGFLCLQSQRISCCALFSLQMLMAQIATYQRRNRELYQMDTLRKASELHAVVRSEGVFEGNPGYLSGAGELESFTDNENKVAGPEKALRLYGLVSLVLSLGLGIFAITKAGFAAGIQVMTGALLVSMPATAYISISGPGAILEKRLHKLGAVLCGWQGVGAAKKGGVYPLTHQELVPEGSVKFNGVKFLGNADPDVVVSFAAALAKADGGSLSILFERLRSARNGRIRKVSDLHSYEGGLSGVVDGLPAILGTLGFMERMGIAIPKEARVNQAMCLAVEGQLVGVFAVAFNRSRGANAGLRTLCSYRDISVVMASNDFLLEPDFLRKKFSANTERILHPQRQDRNALANLKPLPEDPVVALTTRTGLAPKAFAVTGARALRIALKNGATVHILGGAIGLAAAAVLTLVGGIDLLTPENLLAYSLIWAVPGWLTTQWTRFL